MGRAVGVELTPAHVRILSLEHAGKKPKILQFEEVPIPADPAVPWEERAAGALKDAFTAAKIPRGRVVAALESGEAILREVSLPFKNEEQIRKTVRFEMESLIHNYTIEQLVVAHYKTGETDKASLLLAAAVPKTVIEKRIKLFERAGIDPVALDLDVAAVFNAMSHAGAIDTDEPHLLVYGTPKFTKLVFIEQRRPRSIRTIRFSLSERSPDEEPSGTDSDVDPISGENIPIVVLSAEDAPAFGALDVGQQQALIKILAKEISRFLLANAASSSPAHILLAGDFEDPRAAEMLQSATKIPVRTFDLLGAVDHPFAKDASVSSSRMAAAMGLAMKGVGLDALGLDFRQEEFQYTKKYDVLKTTALVTVELVIVFLAAVALHFYFKRTDLQRDTVSVLDHQRTLYENVTGETLGAAGDAYRKMDDLYQEALRSSGTDVPIKISAREAWRDLFGAIQKFQQKYGDRTLSDGTLFLELQSLDIQQNTSPGNESLSLTVRGKIRNLAFADLLKQEVSAVETFANADFQGQLTTDDTGLYQFTLQARKGR